MEAFSEYLAGRRAAPSKEELTATLRKYPWFTTARILLEEAGGGHDPLLAFHRLTHPPRQAPEITPHPVIVDEAPPAPSAHDHETPQQQTGIDKTLIETFLSKGEYRIVPDDNTPEYDAAERSSVLDITDDMASEELAEIYLAQGLNAQAREIYARLSLLNPEKSVYFAEIIGKIDSGPDK